jgi:hypothetical protein
MVDWVGATRIRTAALALLLVLAGFTGWPAAPAPGAHAGFQFAFISGTVVDEETGLSILNVQVDAFLGPGGLVQRSFTGPDGMYQLVFDEPTHVRLLFSHPGVAAYTHLEEWYNDKPDFASADVVSAEPGVTLTVDAELSRAGSIKGTLTEDGTGDPLQSICVTTRDETGRIWSARSGSAGLSPGEYEITGLNTGHYTLRFEDCLNNAWPCLPPNMRYITEWYDDASTEKGAQPVAVTAGETADGIDAALALDVDAPAAPTPRPPLEWSISVDPMSPRVGDEIQLHAGAEGEGGIPQFTASITPAEESPVVIEEAPAQFSSGLGGTYLWRLRAVRPGTAAVRVFVNFEAHDCWCPSREHCQFQFYFTGSTSPEVSITVGAAAGDANGDGPVDPLDAALILQLNAGLLKELPGAPDANGDGRVDSVDAALVLQVVAGLLDELPG